MVTCEGKDRRKEMQASTRKSLEMLIMFVALMGLMVSGVCMSKLIRLCSLDMGSLFSINLKIFKFICVRKREHKQGGEGEGRLPAEQGTP